METHGALVLVCRSSELDDFSWFKAQLLRELYHKHKDRITVLDIQSRDQLIRCLQACPAHHDVSEIHLFAEFRTDSLVVSSFMGEIIRSGDLAIAGGRSELTTGDYLPHTTCKIWYWSHGDQPGFSMLKEFAQHFGHRFFFLPIAQLKNQTATAKTKAHPRRQRPTQTPVAQREETKRSRSPFLASSSLKNVSIWLAFIGVSYTFFFSKDLDYSGSYDQVITYADASYDIDVMTSGLRNKDGDLTKHSWVYDKKKWDYSWFVADAWLQSADYELREAASLPANSNNEFWSLVYNKLLEKNQYRLGTVASSLQKEAERRNYDRYELASLTLAFVQHIPYKIPRNDLEVMTPPTTMSKRYGDCDTKSLLYVAIMQQMGFEVSLYVSSKYRHAMAGVNINAMGTYKTHQGSRYYFVETTAVGHRIGQLTTGRVGAWHLIPLTNNGRKRKIPT